MIRKVYSSSLYEWKRTYKYDEIGQLVIEYDISFDCKLDSFNSRPFFIDSIINYRIDPLSSLLFILFSEIRK